MLPQRETRKSHNKSRLGCQTCKRRKIKCDEGRPQCQKCLRFGICCDFAPIPPRAVRENIAAPKASRRGRPRSDWTRWTEQLRLSAAGAGPGTPGGSSPDASRLNVEDLELFHHYMTSTAPTLGDESALWSEGAPSLGFQRPCILDLILALSSYHLSRLRPDDAPRFLDLAEQHATTALHAATAFLRRLDPAHSPALYVISVLVCYAAFARGPTPGNLLLVAHDGQVSWLSLLRGVRLVVSTTGWASVFSGPLARFMPQPGGEGEEEEPPEDTAPVARGAEDWRASLKDISSLIDVCAEQPLREAYRHELRVLEGCCESTFGAGRHARRDARGRMETVIGWIYQLEDPFVEGLRRRDPIAMIILGHFCVLLRSLERYWFIEGWAAHIMDEILQTCEASRRWLAWPARHLGGQALDATPGPSSSPATESTITL